MFFVQSSRRRAQLSLKMDRQAVGADCLRVDWKVVGHGSSTTFGSPPRRRDLKLLILVKN